MDWIAFDKYEPLYHREARNNCFQFSNEKYTKTIHFDNLQRHHDGY